MKIGILTHYYHSTNYGGNLQAYALVHFLRENGIDAEQVSYQRSPDDYLFVGNNKQQNNLIRLIKKPFHLMKNYKAIYYNKMCICIRKRRRAILKFNDGQIPHSEEVYTKSNLQTLGKKYDLFITGSDQVWHPQAVCDAYLLNFPTKSPKISYAASFSTNKVEEKTKKYYKPCFEKMRAISVREKDAVQMVYDIASINAKLVVDPTLLLNKKEWDSIVEDISVKGSYMLCFFLGTEAAYRDAAKDLSTIWDLPIVSAPHLVQIVKADKNFGDSRLFALSPGQLLYIIKNADYVITDSFHITVFSIIFQKQFIAMARGDMGSRLETLTGLFDLSDRYYCGEPDSVVDYVKNLPIIDYSQINYDSFKDLQKSSRDFLLQNINSTQC